MVVVQLLYLYHKVSNIHSIALKPPQIDKGLKNRFIEPILAVYEMLYWPSKVRGSSRIFLQNVSNFFVYYVLSQIFNEGLKCRCIDYTGGIRNALLALVYSMDRFFFVIFVWFYFFVCCTVSNISTPAQLNLYRLKD